MSDVVDAIPEHGQTLDSHTECKPAPFLGIDADAPENIGIDHAAAEQFQPAAITASAAAAAFAKWALTVEFGAGLGEGEEVGTKTRFERFAEKRPDKSAQGSLQLSHGNVAIDKQTLDLMEKRVLAGVYLFVAINPPGRNDAQGRFGVLHDADLHGRCLAAQQDIRPDTGVESVLLVACRVVGGCIQSIEIVVVGFHLR